MAQQITSKEFLEAAKNNDLETVQKYIDANKNDVKAMNVLTENGSTALIVAMYYGHSSIAKALLESPLMNIHVANQLGYTALHYAAIKLKWYDSCLSLFCESNQMNEALLNAKTTSNETALSLAKKNSDDRTVRTLEDTEKRLKRKKKSLKKQNESQNESMDFFDLFYNIRTKLLKPNKQLVLSKDPQISLTLNQDELHFSYGTESGGDINFWDATFNKNEIKIIHLWHDVSSDATDKLDYYLTIQERKIKDARCDSHYSSETARGSDSSYVPNLTDIIPTLEGLKIIIIRSIPKLKTAIDEYNQECAECLHGFFKSVKTDLSSSSKIQSMNFPKEVTNEIIGFYQTPSPTRLS